MSFHTNGDRIIHRQQKQVEDLKYLSTGLVKRSPV